MVPWSCPVSQTSPSPWPSSLSPPQRPPRPKTSLPNLRPTIILSPNNTLFTTHLSSSPTYVPSRTRSQISSKDKELCPDEMRTPVSSPAGSANRVNVDIEDIKDIEKGESEIDRIFRIHNHHKDSHQTQRSPSSRRSLSRSQKRPVLQQYRRVLHMLAVFGLVILAAAAVVSGIIWRLSRRKHFSFFSLLNLPSAFVLCGMKKTISDM